MIIITVTVVPISDIQDIRKGAESDVLVKALNKNKLDDPVSMYYIKIQQSPIINWLKACIKQL